MPADEELSSSQLSRKQERRRPPPMAFVAAMVDPPPTTSTSKSSHRSRSERQRRPESGRRSSTTHNRSARSSTDRTRTTPSTGERSSDLRGRPETSTPPPSPPSPPSPSSPPGDLPATPAPSSPNRMTRGDTSLRLSGDHQQVTPSRSLFGGSESPGDREGEPARVMPQDPIPFDASLRVEGSTEHSASRARSNSQTVGEKLATETANAAQPSVLQESASMHMHPVVYGDDSDDDDAAGGDPAEALEAALKAAIASGQFNPDGDEDLTDLVASVEASASTFADSRRKPDLPSGSFGPGGESPPRTTIDVEPIPATSERDRRPNSNSTRGAAPHSTLARPTSSPSTGTSASTKALHTEQDGGDGGSKMSSPSHHSRRGAPSGLPVEYLKEPVSGRPQGGSPSPLSASDRRLSSNSGSVFGDSETRPVQFGLRPLPRTSAPTSKVSSSSASTASPLPKSDAVSSPVRPVISGGSGAVTLGSLRQTSSTLAARVPSMNPSSVSSSDGRRTPIVEGFPEGTTRPVQFGLREFPRSSTSSSVGSPVPPPPPGLQAPKPTINKTSPRRPSENEQRSKAAASTVPREVTDEQASSSRRGDNGQESRDPRTPVEQVRAGNESFALPAPAPSPTVEGATSPSRFSFGLGGLYSSTVGFFSRQRSPASSGAATPSPNRRESSTAPSPNPRAGVGAGASVETDADAPPNASVANNSTPALDDDDEASREPLTPSPSPSSFWSLLSPSRSRVVDASPSRSMEPPRSDGDGTATYASPVAADRRRRNRRLSEPVESTSSHHCGLHAEAEVAHDDDSIEEMDGAQFGDDSKKSVPTIDTANNRKADVKARSVMGNASSLATRPGAYVKPSPKRPSPDPTNPRAIDPNDASHIDVNGRPLGDLRLERNKNGDKTTDTPPEPTGAGAAVSEQDHSTSSSPGSSSLRAIGSVIQSVFVASGFMEDSQNANSQNATKSQNNSPAGQDTIKTGASTLKERRSTGQRRRPASRGGVESTVSVQPSSESVDGVHIAAVVEDETAAPAQAPSPRRWYHFGLGRGAVSDPTLPADTTATATTSATGTANATADTSSAEPQGLSKSSDAPRKLSLLKEPGSNLPESGGLEKRDRQQSLSFVDEEESYEEEEYEEGEEGEEGDADPDAVLEELARNMRALGSRFDMASQRSRRSSVQSHDIARMTDLQSNISSAESSVTSSRFGTPVSTRGLRTFDSLRAEVGGDAAPPEDFLQQQRQNKQVFMPPSQDQLERARQRQRLKESHTNPERFSSPTAAARKMFEDVFENNGRSSKSGNAASSSGIGRSVDLPSAFGSTLEASHELRTRRAGRAAARGAGANLADMPRWSESPFDDEADANDGLGDDDERDGGGAATTNDGGGGAHGRRLSAAEIVAITGDRDDALSIDGGTPRQVPVSPHSDTDSVSALQRGNQQRRRPDGQSGERAQTLSGSAVVVVDKDPNDLRVDDHENPNPNDRNDNHELSLSLRLQAALLSCCLFPCERSDLVLEHARGWAGLLVPMSLAIAIPGLLSKTEHVRLCSESCACNVQESVANAVTFIFLRELGRVFFFTYLAEKVWDAEAPHDAITAESMSWWRRFVRRRRQRRLTPSPPRTPTARNNGQRNANSDSPTPPFEITTSGGESHGHPGTGSDRGDAHAGDGDDGSDNVRRMSAQQRIRMLSVALPGPSPPAEQMELEEPEEPPIVPVFVRHRFWALLVISVVLTVVAQAVAFSIGSTVSNKYLLMPLTAVTYGGPYAVYCGMRGRITLCFVIVWPQIVVIVFHWMWAVDALDMQAVSDQILVATWPTMCAAADRAFFYATFAGTPHAASKNVRIALCFCVTFYAQALTVHGLLVVTITEFPAVIVAYVLQFLFWEIFLSTFLLDRGLQVLVSKVRQVDWMPFTRNDLRLINPYTRIVTLISAIVAVAVQLGVNHWPIATRATTCHGGFKDTLSITEWWRNLGLATGCAVVIMIVTALRRVSIGTMVRPITLQSWVWAALLGCYIGSLSQHTFDIL